MKIKNIKPQRLSISVWWIKEGYSLLATSPFLFRHALVPRPHWFGTVMGIGISYLVKWGNEATLMLAAGVPLQLSGSILHQGRWKRVIEKLDTEGYIPVTYPQWSCYCDSVLWVVVAVIQSTIQWHPWTKTSIPLPNACDTVDIHSP